MLPKQCAKGFVFAAAGATFFRFFPKIKARYDYGVVIFILTFCLVTVSGYRVEQLFELAHQRLSTILIGATACMVISIFICPVWAGEDLHKLVASNVEKLANYLEGIYIRTTISHMLFLVFHVLISEALIIFQDLKWNIFIAQRVKKNVRSQFLRDTKVFSTPKQVKSPW